MRLAVLVAAVTVALLLLMLIPAAESRPHNNNRRHKQKSRIDRAWRERRNQCEASAPCSHLEEHPKMLCALRCLSSECYTSVYGPPAEELEEGEIDVRRERSFEDCVRVEEKHQRQQQSGGGYR